MAKIPEAQARLFKNVFICKNCQSKLKTEPLKVLERKAKCRKCAGRNFRPVKKK